MATTPRPPRPRTAAPERTLERHLAALVASSEDAIIGKTLDGVVVSWNEGAERLYGYTAAEVIGRPITLIIPQHQPDELPSILARLARGERIEHYETVRRHKDGHLLEVSVTISPIRDDTGAIVGASAIARDIGERRRLERLVRAQEERLRFTIEAARVGTWEWDISSGGMNWSDILEAIHGLTPGSFQGRFNTFLSHVHPDDRGRVGDALSRAVEQGDDYAIEYRIGTADGPARWVADQGRAFRDAQGRAVRMVGITRDITAGKQAEAALGTSREQLGAILASVADGIAVQGPDGELLFANDAAARLIGFPSAAALVEARQGEILPRFQIFDESGALLARERLPGATATRTRQPVDAVLRYVIIATGEERWSHVRAVPVLDEHGAVQFTVTAFQDITERQHLYEARDQALAEAQQALALRDEFLSSVSHDLRTPLATIKGLSQLLIRQLDRLDLPQAPRFIERLQTIDRSAGKMSAMVDELLDLARLQAGQSLQLSRQRIDLVALAGAAVREQARLTPGHQFVVEPATPALTGMWDPVRLERVLTNLLSNAVKYSPDGSAITVTLRPVVDAGDPWAELVVADQGVGIPAADLPYIFERFHRGANVSDRVAGAGIGLAGVKRIVEHHEGTIVVRSEPGAGTVVTVRLPCGDLAPGVPEEDTWTGRS